jgi:cellulose synthase (UDP-forming)
VTLVVGGWNLLNLFIVGCALGVVSERREMQRTRRIPIQRGCEFLRNGEWVPGTIMDVSVHGARIQLVEGFPDDSAGPIAAAVRFKPYTALDSNELPLTIQNIGRNERGPFVGCRFAIAEPVHYRLVADLVFANADQWTAIQKAKRVNIGLLRGTLWFYGTALFQTARGIGYFIRSFKKKEPQADVQALIQLAERMREQEGAADKRTTNGERRAGKAA